MECIDFSETMAQKPWLERLLCSIYATVVTAEQSSLLFLNCSCWWVLELNACELVFFSVSAEK